MSVDCCYEYLQEHKDVVFLFIVCVVCVNEDTLAINILKSILTFFGYVFEKKPPIFT